MLAPIVLFVYNRPDHTQSTVEALRSNDLSKDSVFYIYSDAAKDEYSKKAVDETRKYVRSIDGFKEVILVESERNLGLANSIIRGINDVFKTHTKAIVLEDDIVCSKNFLSFMNKALDKYYDDPRIFSISGYTYNIQLPAFFKEDVYLSKRASSWGWAIWKDRWEKIDWSLAEKDNFKNNKSLQQNLNQAGDDLSTMLLLQLQNRIDSWAIRFVYAAHKMNSYHLFPTISKTKNIGHDNTGIHSKKTSRFDVLLDEGSGDIVLPDHLNIDEIIIQSNKIFFKKNYLQKLYNRLRVKIPIMEKILKKISNGF